MEKMFLLTDILATVLLKKKGQVKKKSSLGQPSKVDFVGDLEQIQKFFELKRSPRLPPANTLVLVLALNAQRDRVFKI